MKQNVLSDHGIDPRANNPCKVIDFVHKLAIFDDFHEFIFINQLIYVLKS